MTTLNEFPAVALVGAVVKTSWVAVDAVTAMLLEEMLSVPSVAERVLLPAVFKVIWKEPTPLVRVAGDGRFADGSEEVTEMVPVYPVAVLPEASLAVRVKLTGDPAVVAVGTADRTSWVAGDAPIRIFAEVTARLPEVAVRVWYPPVLKVIEKLPVPLLSEEGAGSMAWESEEVIAI